MANLLLHSLTDLREPIFGVLDAVEPNHVVEIGSETGGFTALLVAWASSRGARVTTIDPAPDPAVHELAASHSAVHRLVLGRSPAALADVEPAEAYVIDGDHNYYTVSRELEHVHVTSERTGAAAIVLLHDVGWPCGRRDQYYAPGELPAEHVHPHSYERGVHLDSPETIDGGFRGRGAYAYASHEGGPHNGVLTAVDDFVAAHEGYAFVSVPAVLGLGVLYPRAHPRAAELAAALRGFAGNPLLARLEENRMRSYLEVIALQDREGAIVAHRDAVVADRDALRATVEALHGDVAALRAELAAVRDERDGVTRDRDAVVAARRALEERLAALEARWFARLGGRIDRELEKLPRPARRRPVRDE